MAASGSWRLGALIVAALYLGLLGWVALDLQQSWERELQSAEHLGSALGKLLEGHFLGSVHQIDQHLTDFVVRYQSAVVAGQARAPIEAQLHRYMTQSPEVHSFRVADAAGNYLYDASGSLAEVNIADRDYFIRLRDGRSDNLAVSEPLVSRVTGDIVLVLARRLEDSSGNFSGIVLATLRADHFEKYYRALNISRQGVIALWSRDMRLFARWPEFPDRQGQPLVGSPIPQRLQAGEPAGSFRQAGLLDGKPRIFVYRAVEGMPFVLTVGFLTDEVLAEWRQRAAIYGVLGVLLLFSLLALLRTWSRGYRKAEALAEEMTRAYAEKARESRALLDSIPDPAWLLDNDGRFLAVNEAFCRYRQRSMNEVIGSTVEQLFPAEEARQLRLGQLETYRKGAPLRQMLWLQLQDRQRPFEFLRVPVYGDAGEIRGLTGVAWDMSERYESEERQRLITHFFDNVNDAVLILDRERRVLTINRAVTAISGYELADLKGRQPRFLVDGKETLDIIFKTLDAQEAWQGELLAICKDGSRLPVECQVRAIYNDAGELVNWSVFVVDLRERKAAEARIESLTHFDQLTALPNRQGFARLIGDWLSTGKRGLLLLIDLDDQLSRINDAFGHHAGDTVLRRMAGRLNRALADGDALGRLGGDQFGILIDQRNVDREAPETVVRKLLDNLVRPIGVEGSDIVFSTSAGVCRLFEDGDQTAVLLRNVDTALHHARSFGPNNFRFFSADMNQRVTERLRLESDLRSALSRSELEVHYQPQVDLNSGWIVGFESLLRWRHPELGMVPPTRFIPIAEESRLILPIGAWVLEQACRQNKAWQDAGMPPKVVAVNLSAIQFHDSDIVELVRDVLTRTGLPPPLLELEITESVIVEDPERVILLMEALKAIGVGLSIDDFGTGYSSLSYLKRFPIDKIKIDRAFVRDLETSGNDAAIARMVIGIAAELEHKVIAEGVETAGQVDFLRHHGCDEYQGFYCSPAVPAEQIPALVATRHD